MLVRNDIKAMVLKLTLMSLIKFDYYNIMNMIAEMTMLITMMMTMTLFAQRIDDKGDGFADDIGYI